MGCCCGTLEEEACGWPKNTVRAIIAVTIVVLAFSASTAAMMYLLVSGQYVVALGIQSGIWGTLGVIVTFYFTSKQNDAAIARIVAAKDDVIAEKHQRIVEMAGQQRGLRVRRMRAHPIVADPLFQATQTPATSPPGQIVMQP